MRSYAVVLVVVIGGCVERPETSTVTQSLDGNLAGGVDVGNGPCPSPFTGTCRFFELYADAALVEPPEYDIGVVAYCDGRAYAAPFNTLKITCGPVGCGGGGQINVALIHDPTGWPSNRACYFQLQQKLTTPITVEGHYTFVDPSYSNRFGPVAKILTTSVVNNGLSGTTQRFTLYGSYPGLTSAGAYTPIVTCDGAPASGVAIEGFSTGHVQLRFTTGSSGPWRDCVLGVRRVSDNVLSTTYHARIGGPAQTLPARFAGYVWSGHTSPQATAQLTHGVQSAREAGMRSVRLRLAPGMRLAERAAEGGWYENFGMDAADVLAGCPADEPFLGCAVALPAFQAAMNAMPMGSPGNPIYVPMTVYDSSTTGPFFLNAGNLTNLTFLNDHAQQIIDEYHDLAYALYETQVGTGRTFIIANWETENQFGANGNAYALKRWLDLRQQGIASGRAAATAAGLTSVSNPPPASPAHVADGIEFVRRATGPNYSALHSIIAGYISWWDTLGPLCPEYALWSAWEGSNAGTLDEDIPTIRAKLQQVCGSATTLIFGELGPYPQDANQAFVERDYWHFQETVRAAYRWNLPVSVLWEAYSTSAPGVLFPDGSDREQMRRVRTDINNYIQPGVGVFPPQSVQIHSIRDRGTTSGQPSQRNFELYGSFPAIGTYAAKYRCDNSGERPVQEITYGPVNGQMNIRIENPAQSGWSLRFCNFWVTVGATRSPEVGPRGICPVSVPMNPAPSAPC